VVKNGGLYDPRFTCWRKDAFACRSAFISDPVAEASLFHLDETPGALLGGMVSE
jgi:hypothetical protein